MQTAVQTPPHPLHEPSEQLRELIRGGGAVAALCPVRRPAAHVAVDFGSGARGAEEGPRRPLSRCVWLPWGADGGGNSQPKIKGSVGGSKMMGIWMLVPGGYLGQGFNPYCT